MSDPFDQFDSSFLWALAQRALQVLPAGLVPVLVPGQALTARKRIGTYEYQVEVWGKKKGLGKQMSLC